MKKTLILVLVLFMLCLTGCGKTKDNNVNYPLIDEEKTSDTIDHSSESSHELLDEDVTEEPDTYVPDEELVMPEEEVVVE